MQIETTRFGTIEVKDESIVHIKDGMLGFEECTNYALLEDQPENAIKWMQAVENPAVAFMVINPNEFFPDYEVELTDDQADSLTLTAPSDCVMFTTVSISKDKTVVTTNLVGPIILNIHTMEGRQIALQDDLYSTKHAIGQRVAEREMVKAA